MIQEIRETRYGWVLVGVTFMLGGMGTGGYQGGLFFDLTGDYVWSYTNAGIAGVVNIAILALFRLRIRSRRAVLTAAAAATA